MTRNTEIETIIESINQLAIPFFNLFVDVETLIGNIKESGSFYGISDVSRLTAFLMYASTKETIETTLKKFINVKGIWNEYAEAMKVITKNGQVSGGEYWNVLAELTTELSLDLNENKDN